LDLAKRLGMRDGDGTFTSLRRGADPSSDSACGDCSALRIGREAMKGCRHLKACGYVWAAWGLGGAGSPWCLVVSLGLRERSPALGRMQCVRGLTLFESQIALGSLRGWKAHTAASVGERGRARERCFLQMYMGHQHR
jgi:hypothetical protein